MDDLDDHYLRYYNPLMPSHISSPNGQDVTFPPDPGPAVNEAPDPPPIEAQSTPSTSSHLPTLPNTFGPGAVGTEAGALVSPTRLRSELDDVGRSEPSLVRDTRVPPFLPTAPDLGSFDNTQLNPLPNPLSPLKAAGYVATDGCIDPALTIQQPRHKLAASRSSVALSRNSSARLGVANAVASNQKSSTVELGTRYIAPPFVAPGANLTPQELADLVGLLEQAAPTHPSSNSERGSSSYDVQSSGTSRSSLPWSIPSSITPASIPEPRAAHFHSPRPQSHRAHKPTIPGTEPYRLPFSSPRKPNPDLEYIIQQHQRPDSLCRHLPKTKLQRHWNESCKANLDRLENKERKWRCATCGMGFVRKESLTRHEENFLGSCAAGGMKV